MPFICLAHNGLCKWSAGLKVMNFQLRTEPIRLFNISNLPSSRQKRIGGVATTNCSRKTAETHITFTFCYGVVVLFQFIVNPNFFPNPSSNILNRVEI